MVRTVINFYIPKIEYRAYSYLLWVFTVFNRLSWNYFPEFHCLHRSRLELNESKFAWDVEDRSEAAAITLWSNGGHHSKRQTYRPPVDSIWSSCSCSAASSCSQLLALRTKTVTPGPRPDAMASVFHRCLHLLPFGVPLSSWIDLASYLQAWVVDLQWASGGLVSDSDPPNHPPGLFSRPSNNWVVTQSYNKSPGALSWLKSNWGNSLS